MSSKKAFCENCGEENLADAKFCNSCGTRLPQFVEHIPESQVSVEPKSSYQTAPNYQFQDQPNYSAQVGTQGSPMSEVNLLPPFEGSSLEALQLVVLEPERAGGLFLSGQPMSIRNVLLLFLVFISILSYLEAMFTNMISISNGVSTDISTLIIGLSIPAAVVGGLLWWSITSVILGMLLKNSFPPDSIAYHKPIATMFRVNAFRSVIIGLSSLFMTPFFFNLPKRTVEVEGTKQTVINDWPDYYYLAKSYINLIFSIIAIVVLYRILTKTFRMRGMNLSLSILLVSLPLIFNF